MSTIIKIEHHQSICHYYEAHITIEPVFESNLDKFKLICDNYNFRVAKLLLQKRKEDLEERSKNDSFCTGHSAFYHDIKIRMLNLLNHLEKEGFKIWRYKIESIVLDSRYDDSEYPLDKEFLPEKEKIKTTINPV